MIKKFALTFGTSLAILSMNIVTGILTARLLGPLGKGQLTAVTLWPVILASVGSLGLVNAIVYYSGKSSDEKTQTIWSGSFTIGLIQTLVLITLGFFLLPFIMGQYSNEMIWIARFYLLFIPLNIFNLYGTSMFLGRMRIVPYNILRFLVFGIYFVGVIILAFLDKVSVQTCTAVLLASNAIVLIVKLFWMKKLGWLGNKIDFSLIRHMLGYGLKSHIGNISSLLNLRMDQMAMAIFLTPDMLGLYIVAVTTSSGVSLIARSIATLSFPTISAQNIPEMKKMVFARSIRLTFWFSALIATGLFLTIDFLIIILFGQAYSQAVPAARVLIVAVFIAGLNMTLASGLKGYGKPDISSLGELISLFFTGILLWLFLPRWGILGAAVASLVAYSCNFLFMYLYIWRKSLVNLKETLLPQTEDYSDFKSLITSVRKNKFFSSGKEVSF